MLPQALATCDLPAFHPEAHASSSRGHEAPVPPSLSLGQGPGIEGVERAGGTVEVGIMFH